MKQNLQTLAVYASKLDRSQLQFVTLLLSVVLVIVIGTPTGGGGGVPGG